MMHKRRWLLVGALVLSACGGSEEASCTTPRESLVTHQYRQLGQSEVELGADVADVSLDVHASPTASGCPAILWVHGGSWQEGDKQTTATSLKADHFVASGHVLISVNYRLAAEDNDIRWPDFGTDVAAATTWVMDNAEALGVDASRVSLMGHSSGAHLASIVGTNPVLLGEVGRSPEELACVISLDSVTHDLTDAEGSESDIIELAFPGQVARVDGSPTLQAEQHASVDTPEFLIVTRGRQTRLASSERLAKTLTDANAAATVLDVSPYDHREVNVLLGVDGEQVLTPAVDAFLESCNEK